MVHFGIMKADCHIVPCVSEVPEGAERIAIAVHGFTSSKESATVQMLLERFPAAGVGVVGIDLPGHGSGEALEEELRIEGAKDSIAAAEAFIAERWPEAEICYFGSSFGAYLTGLYISTREHRGRKAFWRSAAVNMPSLFIREQPTEADRKLREELDRNGFIMTGLGDGKTVKVTQALFDDFAAAENDLLSVFDPEHGGHHAVAMAHGEKDMVIDPAAAKAFAAKFGIPVTMFPGKGHSLGDGPDDDTPLRVADLALDLFCGRK